MLPLRSPIPPALGLIIFAMVIAVSCTQGSTIPGIGYLFISLSLLAYRAWRRLSIGPIPLVSLIVLLALQGALYSTTYASVYFGSSRVGWYVVGGLILALLLPDCLDIYPLAMQKLSLPLASVPPLAQTIIIFLLITWQIVLSPCLLTLPYIPLFFLALYAWAMPKSRHHIALRFASKRKIKLIILFYTWCQGLTMYVLSLPGRVASNMNSTLWLPQMIGSPMVKEYKSENPAGFQMNFSVMLFSVAVMLLQATLLPWFIQPYEPLNKQWYLLPTLRTPSPSRHESIALTASASTTAQQSPFSLTHRCHQRASSGSLEDGNPSLVAENGLAYAEDVERKKRSWLLRAWVAFLDTIALSVGAPLILICWAIVIPSTLATVLQIAGCALLLLPTVIGTRIPFGVIVCYTTFLTVLNIVCSIPWTFGEGLAINSQKFYLKSIGFHFYNFGDTSQIGWRFLAIALQCLFTCILAAIWHWHFSSTQKKSTSRDDDDKSIFPGWLRGRTAQYIWNTIRRVLTHADFAVVCILFTVMIVLFVSNESNVLILIYLFFALVLIVEPEGIIKQLVTKALILSSVICCSVSIEYAIWEYSSFSLDSFPTVFRPAIAHLCVFLVAILPDRLPPAHDLHRSSTPIGAFLREHWTIISRIAVYIALFWTLWVALTKPVDVYSIIMLAIFVVQIAIYQLLFKNSERYFSIIVVNYALAYFCIIIVGWRCVALYPSIYQSLTESLRYPLYLELGIDNSDAGIWKTSLTAFTAVICMRMVRFASSLLILEDLEQNEESNVDSLTDPRPFGTRVLEALLIHTARVLPSVVIYCIFLFSVFETSLASVVLMIASAVILCVGRGWSTFILVVSLAISIFFILQYVFRFSFTENSIALDTEQWLGFSWTGASVGRNIGILILCVVQRNVDYTVRYSLSPWGRKSMKTSSISLAYYTPAIAASALMIAAGARSNVYSYMYYCMATSLMYAAKHGASPRLHRLLITCFVLVFCIIIQLLLRLWYPPWCTDCPSRFDGSLVCGPSWINAGRAYTASCQDDWQRFLVAPESLQGNTALHFYPTVPSYITVMNPIPNAALIWELSGLWIIVLLIRNIRIGLNRDGSRGSRSGLNLTRQNAQLSLDKAAKTGVRRPNKWSIIAMRLWIYLLWLLTLLSAFAYTMETNVMTDIMLCMFIGLLRFHFESKAARRHMVVITMCTAATIFGVQLFYQIPFIPCRVWQDACNPLSVVDDTARVPYISRATCVHLQDVYHDNRDRCGALVEHDVFTWLQIFFQVIGFGKSHGGITLPFPFGFGPVLLTLCAALIQLRIYDSPSYDVIETAFIQQVRSRKARARRFINEFNANLFILSRQATCTIGGIAAKLGRVREKVNTFVDINQKGFDVTVTTRLAVENRLSIGSNRLDLLEQGGTKAGFKEVETMQTEQLRIDGFSEYESRRALEICHRHPHEAQALLSDVRRFGLGKLQESQVLLNYTERLKESFEEEPPGILVSIWQWLIHSLESGTNSMRFLEDWRAADPQTLQTRAGGLIAVAAKYLTSSTIFFVYLFLVLDFLVATSIFDAARIVFALWFVPQWPLQPRWIWEVLIVATAIWFVIRMAYQTPLLCGAASTNGNFGILWRFGSSAKSPVYFESGYGSPRMATVYSCPKYVDVGWDVWIGIAKVTGESALPNQRSAGLIGYVWADVMLLLALCFHKWSLQLCGLWDYVQVADPRDQDAAILVLREGFGIPDSVDDTETEGKSLSQHTSEWGLPPRLAATPTTLVRGDTVYQSICSSSASDIDYVSAVSTTIGSFADINGVPLISVGYAELSRYATSRYMCNEDVQGRCVPAGSSDLLGVNGLLDGYRRMRWLSQQVYANKETLRFSQTDSDHTVGDESTTSNRTDWLSRIYHYLDPFAAHKVGHDYYITIFLLALFLWIWCILTYHRMSGDTSEDVLGALKSNKFSASLASLMISHLILIVLDRAYYRASCMNDTGTINVDLSQTDIAFTSNNTLTETSTVERCRMSVKRKIPRVAMGWFIFRAILLVAIVLALHITILANLVPDSDASGFTPVIQNWAMSIYYMVFILYLVVSLMQLRDGVPRVWRDSLRPDKSWNAVRNMVAGYAFSAYKVIPFLQEIRTTVDWAVTPTSLDLSQYFLLEDAHNNFWDVSGEMDDRRENWPAERKQFWWEKCMSGCCLTVILVIIITLPIMIFSTLSPFSKNAYITEASMKVSLNIQSCESDCESPYYIFQDLYSSPILHSVQITGSAATKFLQTQPGVSTDAAVQNISFPLGSSTVIQASPNKIRSLTDLIGTSTLEHNLRVELKLAVSWSRSNNVGYTSSGDFDMSLCGCDDGVVQTTGNLCKECSLGAYPLQFDDFRMSISSLLGNPTASVLFPNFGPSIVHIDTNNEAQWNGYSKDPSMWYSLVSSITGSQGSQFASMGNSEDDSCPVGGGVVCSNDGSTGFNGVGFTLMLDKVFGGNEVGGFLSLGILGFYITIIYAIGQFIRVMFQDASQKVIYSEIPNPQELLDLISGVAIAQVYGDTRREFVMYNCLVKILRSPETLIGIGGADLTGYGAHRNDQPPYPDLLGPLDNHPPPIRSSESSGAGHAESGDVRETPHAGVAATVDTGPSPDVNLTNAVQLAECHSNVQDGGMADDAVPNDIPRETTGDIDPRSSSMTDHPSRMP